MQELAVILVDTDLEICFSTDGGSFELALMYNGLLLGILVFKSNDMSK